MAHDDCLKIAYETIDKQIDELIKIKLMINEKKGSNSRIKRRIATIFYIIGIAFCVYFSLAYGKTFLNVFAPATNEKIVIFACASSVAFFFILILRNVLEGEYYKVLHYSETTINNMIMHEERIKYRCSNYNYSNYNAGSTDHKVVVAEDCDELCSKIKRKIATLEIGNTEYIYKILNFVYYITAMSVGAVLILKTQQAFLGLGESLPGNTENTVFIICAGIGIIFGPIMGKSILTCGGVKKYSDGLIFLIIVSGILSYLVVCLVAALIIGLIALVIFIVEIVIEVLKIIIAIIIAILIFGGILSGG